MNRFLLLSIFIVSPAINSYAQAPGLFNYQGVARNSVGNVLQNKNISLRLSIHDGNATGTIVYAETRVVTTNPLGLFNVQVGSSGATNITGNITSVNWAVGNKYIQVEIDPNGGSSFINIGTAQLASVPYALNAAAAAPTGPAGGSLTGTYPNPTITNGAITQVMIAPGVSLPPNGAAGGDLSGTYPNPVVAGIRGVGITNTAPLTGQVLQFNGTNWIPGNSPNYWTLNGANIFNNNTGSVSIGTTTPHASAMLDITNTGKGFLIPRMSTTERNAIASPAKGLLVFDNDTSSFWFYNGAAWIEVSAGNNDWGLAGNAGTNPATHFIGTIDETPVKFRINNINAGFIDSVSNNTGTGFRTLDSYTTGLWNSAYGYKTLMSTTTGSYNTATGGNALRLNSTGSYNTANGVSALFSNTTGSYNTAHGHFALTYNTTGLFNVGCGNSALQYNTTGISNTAIGSTALPYNTTGNENTAAGESALFNNLTGSLNVAIGTRALYSNTIRSNLVAVGDSALYNNTGGFANTAVGSKALLSNTSGYYNTAHGSQALYNNVTGIWNTATGAFALFTNSNGAANTAHGYVALYYNSGGRYNTANGEEALYYNSTGNNNTAVGLAALLNNTTGSDNIAIGYRAGTALGTFNNTISIGNDGYLNGFSNQAFIGNLSTAWIGGNVGWSTFSDARAKVNMSDDVKGLDFITRLKPVTYYRKINAITEISGNKPTEDFPEKYDIEKIKFSGFLAQEVEQAAKDAGYDFNGINRPKKQGDLYSLSYESFVVPLVKAMQEQQQIIENLNKKLEQQQQQIETLLKQFAVLEKKN